MFTIANELAVCFFVIHVNISLQLYNGAKIRSKRMCSTSPSIHTSPGLAAKLTEAGKKLGIDPDGPLDQWYRISKQDILRAGTIRSLIAFAWATTNTYSTGMTDFASIPLVQLLSTAFPAHQWHPWLFKNQQVPRHFWTSKQNQLWFLRWLEEHLNLKSLDDYYSIKHDHFGGHQLLDLYDGSPFKLLSTIYADHQWVVWKLDRLPRSWWSDPQHQLEYMEWAAKCLNVQSLEDWYNVSQEKFVALSKGSTFFNKLFTSTINFLHCAYRQIAAVTIQRLFSVSAAGTLS